ncbi:hypothetical protein [Klebsiella variicola]|uniref:hypothetical protein n=1 Tax=Klebsiella variicola TaxID=244366 RepID=UPI003B5A42AE
MGAFFRAEFRTRDPLKCADRTGVAVADTSRATGSGSDKPHVPQPSLEANFHGELIQQWLRAVGVLARAAPEVFGM